MARKPLKRKFSCYPLLRIGHMTGPEEDKVTKFALKVAQKNFGNTAKKSDKSVQPFMVLARAISNTFLWSLLEKYRLQKYWSERLEI